MRNRRIETRVLSVIAFAAGAILLVSSTVPASATLLRRGSTTGSTAAAVPDPGTNMVGYYDIGEPMLENGSGVGDNLLRLINPTQANGEGGTICAMIYVFDDD